MTRFLSNALLSTIVSRAIVSRAMVVVIVMLVLFSSMSHLFAADTTPSSEVKVLIDVSGSMKKNDPKNFRSPALRLLVGLLPADSEAGVWNFGTQIKEIVKTAKTDEDWKTAARNASKIIHSRDLFTNIGTALTTATDNWSKQVTENQTKQNSTENFSRNLIILTDGMVDISADEAKNKQERERILNNLLPKIKALNTQIHTIALSENADLEFLKKLSTETDGVFVQSNKADELERIFLHLFEKTTVQDTVPLIDNKFSIDDSIYELTLLVFKDKTAENQNTEVVLPSGESFNQNNAPSSVKWFSENNYDMITMQKPPIGDWSINAAIDPDNRVMVVTNLKIESRRLPNNLFLGENIPLEMYLSDEKEVITDDDFLSLSSISVEKIDTKNNNNKKWFLHDNGLRDDLVANNGKFNLMLGENFQVGKNYYILGAKSETYARELRKSFYVHDIPLLLSHLEIIEGNYHTSKKIIVTPNLEYVRPNKMNISAQLISEDGKKQDITLINDNPKRIEWFFDASKLENDKNYSIIFHLNAHTHRGRPLDYLSKPIKLNIDKMLSKEIFTDSIDDSPIKVTVRKQAPADEIKPKSKAEEPKAEEAPKEEYMADETTDESGDDWFTGIIVAVVVNVVAIILGFLLYRRWKKNQSSDYIDLLGEAV